MQCSTFKTSGRAWGSTAMGWQPAHPSSCTTCHTMPDDLWPVQGSKRVEAQQPWWCNVRERRGHACGSRGGGFSQAVGAELAPAYSHAQHHSLTVPASLPGAWGLWIRWTVTRDASTLLIPKARCGELTGVANTPRLWNAVQHLQNKWQSVGLYSYGLAARPPVQLHHLPHNAR